VYIISSANPLLATIVSPVVIDNAVALVTLITFCHAEFTHVDVVVLVSSITAFSDVINGTSFIFIHDIVVFTVSALKLLGSL
jgi:hypothetical protein